MKHPGEKALAAHVESPDEGIREHVDHCRSCARILSEYESLTAALADRTSWPEKTTELSGLERKEIEIRRAEQAAEELLESLSSAPIATWSARLPHHAGTVKSLLMHAHNLIDAEPQRGLAVADLALRLAGHIRDVSEQHHLRGSAQRERANALRYLGRFPEALRALDDAHAHFMQLPTGDFDIASIYYIRSSLLREQHHLAEAREAVEESARIFSSFGESVRELHARIAMANIDYEDGRFEQARVQYETLLAARELREDDLTLARLHQNLGCVHQQLGEHSAAREQLKLAQRTYDRLEKWTEAARVQWALARTAVTEDDSATAQDELWIAVAMLSELGMRIDAALARLDLAELLLENDDPQGARANCIPIIDDLMEAGMAVPAAAAMDMLRRAAEADEVTLSVVRETRAVLQRLAAS